MSVSKGQVIDSLDATLGAELLDSGYEAPRPWIQSEMWNGPPIRFTPLYRLQIFLWREPRGLRVANEPCNSG